MNGKAKYLSLKINLKQNKMIIITTENIIYITDLIKFDKDKIILSSYVEANSKIINLSQIKYIKEVYKLLCINVEIVIKNYISIIDIDV